MRGRSLAEMSEGFLAEARGSWEGGEGGDREVRGRVTGWGEREVRGRVTVRLKYGEREGRGRVTGWGEREVGGRWEGVEREGPWLSLQEVLQTNHSPDPQRWSHSNAPVPHRVATSRHVIGIVSTTNTTVTWEGGGWARHDNRYEIQTGDWLVSLGLRVHW